MTLTLNPSPKGRGKFAYYKPLCDYGIDHLMANGGALFILLILENELLFNMANQILFLILFLSSGVFSANTAGKKTCDLKQKERHRAIQTALIDMFEAFPYVPDLTVNASPPNETIDPRILAGERYLVVGLGNIGIGNRLRVISSAKIAAAKSKRRLVVDWSVNSHMLCHWHDLFLNPLETFEASPLPTLGISLNDIARAQDGDLVIKNLGLQNNTQAQKGILRQLHQFEEPIVYLETSIPFMPENMAQEEYHAKMNEFYRTLIPNEWIKAQVKAFKDKHKFDDHFMVGVHYRGWQMGKTDKNFKLTNDPNNRYLDDFVTVMKQVLAIERSKTENKPVAFFLAADNQAAKNRLLAEPAFAGLIFTRPDRPSRDNIRGQEEGMVDFFLLGAAEYIIGTFQSSFSAEAARLTKQTKKFPIGAQAYIDAN